MASASVWDSQELIDDHRASRGSLSAAESYDEEPPEIHRKRRAALLGIVQDLDQESGSKHCFSRASSAFMNTEYDVQEGFAVNGSGYFDTGTTAKNEAEIRRDTWRRSHKNDLPADYDYSGAKGRINDDITSPLPTFTVSTEDDFNFTHDRNQYAHVTRELIEVIEVDRLVPGKLPNLLGPEMHQRSDEGLRQYNTRTQGPTVVKGPSARSPAIRPTGKKPVTAQRIVDEILSTPPLRRARSPTPAASDMTTVAGKYTNTPQQNCSWTASSLLIFLRLRRTRRLRLRLQRQAFGIPRPISDCFVDPVQDDAPHRPGSR